MRQKESRVSTLTVAQSGDYRFDIEYYDDEGSCVCRYISGWSETVHLFFIIMMEVHDN